VADDSETILHSHLLLLEHYHLAEVTAGHRMHWKRLENRSPAAIEPTLALSYIDMPRSTG